MSEEHSRQPARTAGEREPGGDPGGSVRRRGRRLLAIFGAGALLSAASLIQAVGNFGFHIASTRILGPAEYARLGALLNLMLFVGVPLVAVQLAATMAVARARSETGENLAKVHTRLWLITGAAVVGLVAAAPAIDSFFKINELTTTLWIAPFIGASILLAGWRGIAIGRGADKRAARSFLIAPVLRLGIGVPFLLAGGGVLAAMVATVAAETAAALSLIGTVRSQREGTPVPFDLGKAGSSAVMLTGLWLFSGVDVFVAVRLLDAHAAGEYLAIAGLARTAMMIPQILASVGVRQWSARQPRRHGATVLAEKGMTVERLGWGWLGVAAAGLGVFWATAGWWMRLLFGAENVSGSAAGTATLMVAGAAVCGVATIASFYFKSRDDRRSELPWAWTVVLLAVLIGVSEFGVATETSLAAGRLGVVAAGAGVLFWLAGRDERAWFAGQAPGPAEMAAAEDPGDRRMRVLHVIGEYIYEEAMGRTIDRLAAGVSDHIRSDVVCASAHSRGPGVGRIIEMGGSPATVMLKQRRLVKAAAGYDMVHFHGGAVALLAAARMAKQKPTMATVYGVATLPTWREWRQVGVRGLLASNVLNVRVVVAALIPSWAQRRAARKVGVVVTHDRRWCDQMRKRIHPEAKLWHARPGARTDLNVTAQYRAEGPEIVFMGRSEKARGIKVLVEAYSQVREQRPDARLSLLLIPTREAVSIRRAAKGKPGVTVSFDVEARPEERLAQAQVGVWPYLADYTTSPPALAPVEALAVGLPIIGSRVACLSDVTGEGYVGGEVEPGDVTGLAEAILELIDNPQRWQEAAEAARRRAEWYSWERYIEHVRVGYEVVLEKTHDISALRRMHAAGGDYERVVEVPK